MSIGRSTAIEKPLAKIVRKPPFFGRRVVIREHYKPPERTVMDITGVNGVGQIPATAPAPAAPEKVAENRDIVQAVKAVNAASSFGDNNEVSFLLDRNTKLPVIRIVNKDTKEVVEQIPAESLLQLAAELAKSGH